MSAPVVAILGASGMLGQVLCLEASRRGMRTQPLHRSMAQGIDLTDHAALNAWLDASGADIVVNCAAQTSLEECERSPGAAYEINARVVAVLALHCARTGRKLVQVSTDHYFTGDGDALHGELAAVSLVNEYARTKFAGEAFAATCPGALILRTNLVGFRGWPGRPTFVEWALQALAGEQPMTLFDDFHTSSIDVERFSRAVFDLVDQRAQGLLNVAAREVASKRDFLLALAARLELPTGHCRLASVRQLPGAPRAESLGLDVRKAETLLGYRLPTTTEVIDAVARRHEERQREVR